MKDDTAIVGTLAKEIAMRPGWGEDPCLYLLVGADEVLQLRRLPVDPRTWREGSPEEILDSLSSRFAASGLPRLIVSLDLGPSFLGAAFLAEIPGGGPERRAPCRCMWAVARDSTAYSSSLVRGQDKIQNVIFPPGEMEDPGAFIPPLSRIVSDVLVAQERLQPPGL